MFTLFTPNLHVGSLPAPTPTMVLGGEIFGSWLGLWGRAFINESSAFQEDTRELTWLSAVYHVRTQWEAKLAVYNSEEGPY